MLTCIRNCISFYLYIPYSMCILNYSILLCWIIQYKIQLRNVFQYIYILYLSSSEETCLNLLHTLTKVHLLVFGKINKYISWVPVDETKSEHDIRSISYIKRKNTKDESKI